MLKRLLNALAEKIRDRRARRVNKRLAVERERIAAVSARLALMEWRDDGGDGELDVGESVVSLVEEVDVVRAG
jgi:hypothetical protein